MLASLFDRDEHRAIQAVPWGDWGDDATPTWAGANVTPSSSLQLLTVYGCTRFICDEIGTLPIDTFTTVGGAPIETEKPGWLTEPTPDLDPIGWCTQILSSLLLAGNAYLWVIRRGGVIAWLVPLDPARVEVRRIKGVKTFVIDGVVEHGMEIKHIPAMMYPGSEIGLSPVEYARQSIGLGMAAQEYGGRFFDSDSTPAGVIEVPGELEPLKAREMARSWAKKHAGRNKKGLPGVLQGGAVWKPTAVTNEQAQFLETRGYTAAEIAGQMFLIDPPDLGIGVQGQSLTYANLMERNTRRLQVTFMPWIVRIERTLSSMLPADEYAKFNVKGILRGDPKTQMETYKVGADIGIYETDEMRAWEELPSLPDKPAPPPTLVEQIEAAGQLIRAGFEPDAALKFLGLPPIKHTGALPITVTPEEPQDEPRSVRNVVRDDLGQIVRVEEFKR